MQSRNVLLLIVGLVVVGVGWYLFRPERLFVNQTVNESLETSPAEAAGMSAMEAMPDAPAPLAMGEFHSVAHETRGVATVLRRADGKRLLRFTGFHTSNGPDVQVYLVAANDATDNATVQQAGFVHVGALKGNVGDQNYELADDVDLMKYRAVTIWCRRFGVNFGTAPLHMEGTSMGGVQALLTGSFHGVAHETQGTATIHQLPGGKQVLRFTGFHTSNGPDVQVYLVAANDATDNETVTRAGFIHIGALKGNIGDQNYELPMVLDLEKYRAVTIWCRRFGVNFGTAPLVQPS
jgi:hypothetical protein